MANINQVAGRHIFLDQLKHKTDFLGIFEVPGETIEVLDKAKSNDFYSQADTWIDTWLNKSAQSLSEKFGIFGGKIKATPFVPLIGLGISGAFLLCGIDS